MLNIRRIITRAVIGSLSLVALGSVLLVIVLALYERTRWAWDPGRAALNETCTRCHSLERIAWRAKSPQEWRRTVDRMLAKGDGNASANSAPVEAIVETLIRRRSDDERWVLRLRCGKCHSVSVIDGYRGLSDRALRLLVNRHVAEHNEAIFAWEADLVFDRIRKRFERPPQPYSPRSERAQVAFESRCDVCHTITFRYRTMFRPRRDDVQWRRVAERMRAKAPDYIREDDVPVLVDYIRRMRDAGSVAPD